MDCHTICNDLYSWEQFFVYLLLYISATTHCIHLLVPCKALDWELTYLITYLPIAQTSWTLAS
jgi:hypothetical protein